MHFDVLGRNVNTALSVPKVSCAGCNMQECASVAYFNHLSVGFADRLRELSLLS